MPLAGHLEKIIRASRLVWPGWTDPLTSDEMIDKNFIDYDGPTGLYVPTGQKVIPLESAEGISAVAQSAMLTSLDSSPEAKEYEAACIGPWRLPTMSI